MTVVTTKDVRTATWHRTMFDEFTRNELAIGGPDPHMRYVGYCVFPFGWQEIVWRLGVYISVYNFATAEVIWQNWSAERVAKEPEKLRYWIKGNWEGLKLRRERRAVRTADKLGRCLLTYAEWAREALPVVMRGFGRNPEQNYEMVWRAVDQGLYGFGRYAAFKLLETYRRYADVDISMPDIRPRGGYSPRMTLNLLDSGAHIDPYDNSLATQKLVHAQAEAAMRGQQERTGLHLDRYRFEVMLCDYRQSYEGQRQYPGRSLDSEIGYWDAITPFWGGAERKTQLWEARAEVTHARGHGETRGWRTTRDELGTVLAADSFTWSDLLYDYPVDLTQQGRIPPKIDGAPSEHQLREMAQETLESRW